MLQIATLNSFDTEWTVKVSFQFENTDELLQNYVSFAEKTLQ